MVSDPGCLAGMDTGSVTKMKVALVTNTHYDVIIPLAKHLSKLMEIDLFSIISRKGSGRQVKPL